MNTDATIYPYDFALVAASVLVAIHSALLMSEVGRRMSASEASHRSIWMLGGSVTVGTGLWASQLIGLLAFNRPAHTTDETWVLVFTWALGVAVAAATLWQGGRPNSGVWYDVGLASASSAVLAVMHVAGLSGLAPWSVEWGAVVGSFAQPDAARLAFVLCGCVAIGAALQLITKVRRRVPPLRLTTQGAAAIPAGLLLAVAHYAFAEALITEPHVVSGHLTRESLESLAFSAVALMLLASALGAMVRARVRDSTLRLAQSLEAAREDVQRNLHRDDSLTGLPNRTFFEDRLSASAGQSMRDGTRLAVVFVDLDGFKPINDAFGYEVGDSVLREVAARLRALTQDAGSLARVGGDEFVMLIAGDPDKVMAAQTAARVLESLQRPIAVEGRDVSISCSIGIVFFPADGAQIRLIAHANAAMNAAKRIGGSTYAFFEARMDTDAREQIELLRDLRRALERSQLELYYQPKVDTRSGQITGVEALLRWHHPAHGLIGPNVFIPLAERFGLVGALGSWVIEEALRQTRAWRAQGLRMRVAINLSLHQVREDDLASRITEALKRHGVHPALLTCEITESVAMEDTPATQKAFRRLTATGVKLSIDDFGTGYSSLAYLRKLSAQELKIDRSFVQDLESGDDARAIVAAVVTLAHALSMTVVAEGVETAGQRQVLADLGCDQMQGYLFAKPMSAAALLSWASAAAPRPLEFRPSLFKETLPGDSPG